MSLMVNCRICTSKNFNFVSIFSKLDNGFVIANLITFATGIKISFVDPFPNIICNECVQKTLATNDFIGMCRTSEERYSRLLELEEQNAKKISVQAVPLPMQIKVDASERINDFECPDEEGLELESKIQIEPSKIDTLLQDESDEALKKTIQTVHDYDNETFVDCSEIEDKQLDATGTENDETLVEPVGKSLEESSDNMISNDDIEESSTDFAELESDGSESEIGDLTEDEYIPGVTSNSDSQSENSEDKELPKSKSKPLQKKQKRHIFIHGAKNKHHQQSLSSVRTLKRNEKNVEVPEHTSNSESKDSEDTQLPEDEIQPPQKSNSQQAHCQSSDQVSRISTTSTPESYTESIKKELHSLYFQQGQKRYSDFDIEEGLLEHGVTHKSPKVGYKLSNEVLNEKQHVDAASAVHGTCKICNEPFKNDKDCNNKPFTEHVLHHFQRFNKIHDLNTVQEGAYSCILCNTYFARRDLFQRHKRSFLIYDCKDCGVKCHTNEVFKIHRRTFHSDKNLYSCEHCDESISNLEKLWRHKKSHQIPLQASNSDSKDVENEDSDQPPLKKPKESTTRTHKFNLIRTTSNEELRELYLKAVKKDYVCCGCFSDFDTEKELMDHSVTHNSSILSIRKEGQKAQCKVCYKWFGGEINRKKHLDAAYKVQGTCKICNNPDRKGKWNLPFERHLLQHFRKQRQESIKTPKIKCLECGEICYGSKHLSNHMISHRYRGHCKSKDNITCRLCNKFYKDYHSLVRHNKWTEKFDCPECGVKCHGEKALRVHTETFHGQKRSFPCKYCKDSFAVKETLVNHIKLHETKVNQNFEEKDAAEIPKVIVTGRNYTCKACGKSFKYQANLATHKKNAKRFDCKECGEKCHDRNKLKTHMEADHGLKYEPTKIIKCLVCNSTFSWKKNLQLHMKNFHKGVVLLDDVVINIVN